MIDVLSILLSTGLVVFVIFRAYVANKAEVWFTATPTSAPAKDQMANRARAPFTSGARRV